MSLLVKSEVLHQFNLRFIQGVREVCASAVGSSHARGVCTGPVLSAIVHAYYCVSDRARVMEFCEVLGTGFPKSTSDNAAIRLRNILIAKTGKMGKAGRFEIHKLTEYAISCFIAGRDSRQLRWPDEEIYTLPGWNYLAGGPIPAPW